MSDSHPFILRYACLAIFLGLMTIGGCSQDYTTTID